MKNIIEVKPANPLAVLKWYGIDQNNSGGYHIRNDEVGDDVFVQATSAEEAERKLESIVADHSQYCSCCGERWYISLYHDDGHPEPTKYGVPITQEYGNSWSGEEQYAVCYFDDGRVVKFYSHKSVDKFDSPFLLLEKQ